MDMAGKEEQCQIAYSCASLANIRLPQTQVLHARVSQDFALYITFSDSSAFHEDVSVVKAIKALQSAVQKMKVGFDDIEVALQKVSQETNTR